MKDNIVEQAKANLANLRKELDEVTITNWLNLELDSSDYRTDEAIMKVCKGIEKHSTPVIYRISVLTKDVQKRLVSNYLSFHETNKKKQRGVDRYNTSKFNGGASLTLYVGSSSKFKSRLERHLGKGSIRTFALKINKWDNALSYKLNIQVFKVESLSESPISQTIIELIEQEVWEKHQPVFGKKSGK